MSLKPKQVPKQTLDPLANVIKHPEGEPFHSLISGLSGIIFGSYRELIRAEEAWGRGFIPKNFVRPSSTTLPTPEHSASDY